MATSGLFTYYDLYGGKPEVYHHQNLVLSSSSTTVQTVSIPNTTTSTLPSTTLNLVELISTTTTAATIRASTSSIDKFYKLVQLVPFAYFHWFLIGLAVLFAILLTIIFSCFCRNHCRKNKRSRKEKKQPLPNFYRYRTVNRRAHGYDIFETSAPLSVPSPARSCPPKSIERLNNQLLRQGLDAVGSPHNPRISMNQAKSSTFTDTASNLLTEFKTRLSTHPSELSAKSQRFYETQRANMALADESKNDSLLINMN